MGSKLNLNVFYEGAKFFLLRTTYVKNCFSPQRFLHNQVQNVKTVVTKEIPEEKVYQDTKLLKVTILGLPNVGKSTLINNIVDRKVCPASSKIHTTRKKSHAIITSDKTQIVFLDTPGVISNQEQKKYNLEKTFFRDCDKSLTMTDIIGVVHDVGDHWNRDRLDLKIIRLLDRYKKKPSFLILNKIDQIKSKRKLLDITKNVTSNCLNGLPLSDEKEPLDKDIVGWPNFTEVFMVSALQNDGLEDIKNYLIDQAKPGEWMYPSTQWTDQTPEDIICSTVKATLLDFLPQEIPYRCKVEMEFFEVADDGSMTAAVLVHTPLERMRKLIVGEADGKLRQITEKTARDLQSTFYTHVSLKIVVKAPSSDKK